MPDSMYKLDVNILSILTSFLHPREVKMLGHGSKRIHESFQKRNISFQSFKFRSFNGAVLKK